MECNHEHDECLEQLWYLQEEGLNSLDDLKNLMGDEFHSAIIEELSSTGLVVIEENGARIYLSEKGEEYTRKLIRSHRLAERLVYDVLGGEFEAGACEFEHIVNPGIVDSICTLLGHPKECPHGLPIPEGPCCKISLRTTKSSVYPLTEMKVGESARVAYINCRDDRRLHRLDGLQIRPGATIKLHQASPTIVIECEGANIALDESVCADICLWRDSQQEQSFIQTEVEKKRKKKRGGLGIFKLHMLRNRIASKWKE